MNQANENRAGDRLRTPLRLSRVYPVPPRRLFEMWASAAHLARWFAPEGFATPHAEVDMRVGGKFDLCMRAPSGQEHWLRGIVTQAQPFDRITIDMQVADGAGKPLFGALTEVAFAEAPGGARMDIAQTYRLLDPSAEQMIAGAPQGWRSSLDNLDKELARMEREEHSKPSTRAVAHGAFHLERLYAAPVGRLWSALTEPAAKQKWFAAPGKWELIERRMDVRVGGRERLKGRWESGLVTCFDAVYLDVVPYERLIYAYEMTLDETKISVSLATLQLRGRGAECALIVDEQGAFLNGYEDAARASAA